MMGNFGKEKIYAKKSLNFKPITSSPPYLICLLRRPQALGPQPFLSVCQEFLSPYFITRHNS